MLTMRCRLRATRRTDIVLDDKLVEGMEGFNLLADSSDVTNATIQEGRANMVVQIMDNDI